MKVWATFKEGTRLYREHFGQLFVLNVITFLPAAVIAFAVSREAMPIGNSQEAVDRWATLTGIMIIAMMLWSLVSTATLHYAVGDAYETGRCSWRESLTRCRPRLVVFAGAMGVVALVITAIVAVVYAVATVNETAGAILFVPLILVGSVVGAVFMTVLVPVVVREDVSVRESFTRTWSLIRPKLLLLIGLLLITGFIVGFCSQLMTAAIEGGFQATVTQPTQMLVAVFVSIVVPTLVFTPWTVAVVTIAYIRLREDRGESLDDHTQAPDQNPPHPAAMGILAPGNGQVAHAPSPVPAVATNRSIDDEVLALLQLQAPMLGSHTAPSAVDPTPLEPNRTVDDEILALLQLEAAEPDSQTTPPAADAATPAPDAHKSVDEQVLALLQMDGPQEPARSRPRWSEPLGSS
jgi:MFS family permease